jgi:hypothetical protein
MNGTAIPRSLDGATARGFTAPIIAFVLLFLFFSASLFAQTPAIYNVDPTFAVAGGLGFTLTVTGQNFDSTSVVNWNGAPRGTVVSSSGRLLAAITKDDIALPIPAEVTVTGSGGTSGPLWFRIEGPLASVISWTPKRLTAGVGATLTVYGKNFLPGSNLLFDWQPFGATLISATQLNAFVPGSAIVGSGPHVVRVANPAHLPLAQVDFLPASFTFGSLVIGNTSAPQTTLVTNIGVDGVDFNSIFFGGPDHAEFLITTSDCPFVILPGASCHVSVAFKPNTTGTFSETLTFSDNAGGTPHILSLGGTGTTGPFLSLSSGTLSFGNVQQGLTSSSQTETVTNTGGMNLTFSATPSLSAPISAAVVGASAGSGFHVGDQLSVTGGGGSGAVLQVVTLSGSAIATFTILNPGTRYVTTTGAALTVITGSGTGSPTANITTAGTTDFTIGTETCTTGSPVTPSSTCTTAVTFTPSGFGYESATLTYTDNAGGSPHSVNLTGSGASAEGIVSLSPLSIDFGSLTAGTSSSPVNVTLSNPGAAAVTGVSIAIGGTDTADFSQTNGCSSTLASLASCTIAVTFSPAAIANYSANVTVTSSASSSPDTVTLTGKGIAAPAPAVSLSPGTLAFGSWRTTTTSSALFETVKNTGDATLTTTTIAVSGSAAFTQSGSTCTNGGTVAAGATCTIGIVFAPTTTGLQTATVTITDTAPGSPHTFTVNGTGVTTHSVDLAWDASLSPSIIGYNVYRGTISGGPYTKLTATPVAVLTYHDSTVANSTTYYYVITAVGSNPPYVVTESVDSAQVTAVVGP